MDMMMNLDAFVREVVGHKYALSIAKLLQRKTVALDGSNNTGKFVAENRTFFCSELVAKAYKVMGLLEPEGASSQYLPGR